MNKENCALKLVDEIILSGIDVIEHKAHNFMAVCRACNVTVRWLVRSIYSDRRTGGLCNGEIRYVANAMSEQMAAQRRT